VNSGGLAFPLLTEIDLPEKPLLALLCNFGNFANNHQRERAKAAAMVAPTEIVSHSNVNCLSDA
jgi:hypothetical protein